MITSLRFPSLKYVVIWLVFITLISFTIGGAIIIVDREDYSGTGQDRVVPVNILPDDVSSARITLELETGSVNITAGTPGSLVSGEIRSRNSRVGPRQSYTEENGTGILTIVQESSALFDPREIEDVWNLSLCQDIPLDLSIEAGTGDISVDTGSVSLTSLYINAGVGDVKVDLTRWNGTHMPVTIQDGIGSLIILLPETATIGADVENGLGTRTIDGLDGMNGRYFRSSSQPGAPALSVAINQGLGDLTIKATRGGD